MAPEIGTEPKEPPLSPWLNALLVVGVVLWLIVFTVLTIDIFTGSN